MKVDSLSSLSPPSVDLTDFKVGQSQLGQPPTAFDQFAKHFGDDSMVKCLAHGYEIGLKRGKLDYVFLDLADFKGRLTRHDSLLYFSTRTTLEDVHDLFGEPYWTDTSGGETTLFYEFSDGTVEVQFEFPDGQHLGYITMLRNGVLADSASRTAYGVDRPWPPALANL